MAISIWRECQSRLEDELSSQQFNTWIRPLQVRQNGSSVTLLAPNRYVKDRVESLFMERIAELLDSVSEQQDPLSVELKIGSSDSSPETAVPLRSQAKGMVVPELNSEFTFDSFVTGKSNEMARAAAMHVAQSAGTRESYNPLLLYGGVGLGKTHLMQAVGHEIQKNDANADVVYLHSQRFVQDMVKALQTGTMQEFLEYYRSLDALLIDDIQFFAKKLRSQEEFFHVFNALIERNHQMVLTCDRYPKEIEGLEERLKSRFVWGLTAEVGPPDLETRVAILMKKADSEGIDLEQEVAFYIAERIRSNVRELEGALRRVIANARFTGRRICIEQVQRALSDLFAIQDRQISIDNIQKVTAEYFNIKISDLLSKRRNRSVARPRQIAMTLAKEMTNHSLPEIGEAFGGRDHTTVMHACRKVAELTESSEDIGEDYRNLTRLLTS